MRQGDSLLANVLILSNTLKSVDVHADIVIADDTIQRNRTNGKVRITVVFFHCIGQFPVADCQFLFGNCKVHSIPRRLIACTIVRLKPIANVILTCIAEFKRTYSIKALRSNGHFGAIVKSKLARYRGIDRDFRFIAIDSAIYCNGHFGSYTSHLDIARICDCLVFVIGCSDCCAAFCNGRKHTVIHFHYVFVTGNPVDISFFA